MGKNQPGKMAKSIFRLIGPVAKMSGLITGKAIRRIGGNKSKILIMVGK